MAIIGNQLQSTNYVSDQFSGNGSTVAYTLSLAPASAASVAVYISGLYQTPGIAYTISGTTLTFTGAPPVGTNNIFVLHIGVRSATLVPVNGSLTPAMLNNANVIYWSVSNTNVGIGNTSPAAPLVVGQGIGSFTNPLAQFGGGANSWVQVNIQNANNGNNASSDLVLARSDGTDTSGYIDIGVNSNTYSQAAYSLMTPNSGYVFTNGGDLFLGTQTAHNLVLFAGNTTSTAQTVALASNGNFGIGNTTPADKLSVNGTSYFGSSVNVNGTLTVASNITIDNAADNSGAYIRLLGSNTGRNFLVGNQQNINDAFEITPSTTAGGATFTTPALSITGTGLLCINTSNTSYTISDNTPVVGAFTNNKIFVSGSIQLFNDNDAYVVGRGTSSFFKDEEIGFGWGSGWYMTDSSWLRVRNGVNLYSTGGATFSNAVTSPSNAKAWVAYDGVNLSIKGSYNVSSVSRIAQGNFEFTMTNAVADTNYVVVTGGHNSDNGGGGATYPGFSTNNVFFWGWPYTSSVFRARIAWGNNANYNPYYICLTVFR